MKRIFLPVLQGPVHDAHVGDHAAVGVVLAVEDQGPQRCGRAALRRRDLFDDRPEDLVDADPLLRAHHQRLGRVEADDRLDLLEHFVDPGDRQVDLVDHRNHHQIAVDRRVGVGDGLRLDALEGVDEQQGPFARRQAPRDLVVEIDVPRRVDQVDFVVLALERVINGDGPGLDGDPPVAFDLQIVEHLLPKFARSKSPRF